MPIVNIQGTNINFPNSGDSPNWSAAVDQFAVAVAAALASFVGPADIPPQTYVMVSNANTNVSLPNLSFSTTTVQGAIINYSVYRNTNINTATETGEIIINYNATNPVNNKWEISREHAGDSFVTISITDVGQVQFSSPALAGTSFNGKITYQARAILA